MTLHFGAVIESRGLCPVTLDFGVFVQDGKGPVFREFFADREQAKRKAEELAKTEGVDCFVYSFKTYTEVVRFRPPARKSAKPAQRQISETG